MEMFSFEQCFFLHYIKSLFFLKTDFTSIPKTCVIFSNNFPLSYSKLPTVKNVGNFFMKRERNEIIAF